MDAAAPLSHEELLSELSSPDLREDLVHFAHLRCSEWFDALEFANLAIMYAIQTSAASWDRTRRPRLVEYLGSIVHRLVWARRVTGISPREMRACFRSSQELRGIANVEEAVVSEEQLAAERTRVEARVQLLREGLQKEPGEVAHHALGLIDLEIEGISRPDDQASALGATSRATKSARERLAIRIVAMLESEEPKGASR
jgi:hypothetical protein